MITALCTHDMRVLSQLINKICIFLKPQEFLKSCSRLGMGGYMRPSIYIFILTIVGCPCKTVCKFLSLFGPIRKRKNMSPNPIVFFSKEGLISSDFSSLWLELDVSLNFRFDRKKKAETQTAPYFPVLKTCETHGFFSNCPGFMLQIPFPKPSKQRENGVEATDILQQNSILINSFASGSWVCKLFFQIDSLHR